MNNYMPPEQDINVNLSKDPNIAVEQLMSTITHLSGLYKRETDALQKADTRSFFALQDEKMTTARMYELSVKELMLRKAEIKTANADLKRRLKDMQADFSMLVQNNLECLSRMQRSTDRLGTTLRNAVKDAARKGRVYSYSENGRVDNQDKKPLSTGISETA